jgi:hypothetical protein
MNSGDVRFWRWRKFVVEALVGASTVAIVFAAIDATAEPILVAVVLIGIALMLERNVPAQSAGNIVGLEAARPEPQATVGFDAALVDATSV